MDDETQADGVVAPELGVVLSRRAFLTGTAGAIAGVTLLSAAGTALAAIEPGASFFVPMAPIRLCDTRNPKVGLGFKRLDAKTIRVRPAGSNGVPADAVAVVITLTGVNRNQGRNWLAAYPAGSTFSGTSNSNSEYYDQRIANLVTVMLGRAAGGAHGAVDIKSLWPTEVVVDIAGYYVATAVPVRAGRLEVIEPYRALDTRLAGGRPNSGGKASVDLTGRVPADALAVAANVTAVNTTGQGFLTAYPFNTKLPDASCLNFAGGETRPSAVMVKLGQRNGRIGFDIYAKTRTDLVVDILGYITGPNAKESGDGLFVPIVPRRIYDSRYLSRRIWPGGTATFIPPSPTLQRASAVAMNLTVTSTIGRGFFTVMAGRTPRREVSSLNAGRPGQTIANHVISRVSPGGIDCFTQSGAHIICDVTGWYTGKPTPIRTARAVNPPPPGGPLPWVVQVPRFGLNQWVVNGDAGQTVNSGKTWHWTGTGLVGQGTNVVLFGHRTEHGGPYRYQHTLRAGDWLHIYTSDNRRYNYQMVAEYISSKYPSDILAKTRLVRGETVSLVSCSKTNRLPTSLQNRLISTFRLIGWDDLG